MNGPKRSSEPRRHSHRQAGGRWSPLAAALLLALPGGFAFAGEGTVYTWKDPAGRVHYGNRPPEGQPAQPVNLNAKPVTVQPTGHIYTWTDTDGQIHYGPQPPPDTPARELQEDDSSLSTIRASKLREGEQRLLQDVRRRP